MEFEVCMNIWCQDNASREWKQGWPLRSAGFARLCEECGSAYANSIFCETFHKHQAGWRECNDCGKPIHCGCIVSRSLFEYRDSGGIDCVTCAQASQLRLMRATENLNAVRSIKNNANDRHTEHIDGRLMVDGAGKGKMVQLCRIVEASEPSRWPQSEREVIDSCNGLNKQDDTRFSNVMKPPSHSLAITTSENNGPTWVTGSMDKSHPLNISIGTSSGNSVLTSALESLEERLEGKALSSPFHQGQRSLSMKMEGLIPPQERIARPPADGIGKSLLLSRYWPKMTDHELEKLSECMKSIVVPLFEKTLSSSDASRIGRLVLPKSCAEVYFPPITQSEGLPLQMLDVMGNEWIFQFRFWPNNNSRMYVLEGVTPCMQALQLNAGDTVIFSQMHPGGKYVFGFRRASGSTDTQEANLSGATANLRSGSSYHNLLLNWKRKREAFLNGCSEHLRWGIASLQTENCDMVNNDLLQLPPISVSERMTQTTGPKRLLPPNDDATELRVTLEEAQNLLSPPPKVKPGIIKVEDQEFEEYEEPPVFGKRTAINAHPLGSLNSASKEMSPKELDNILTTSKDLKKRRSIRKPDTAQEHEPHGLNALASAAALGDDLVEPVGATTKHPRHRLGCSCIVCSQPPSGKGKHKPTCTCIACVTMKRRCNTLMARKRKRGQSDDDALARDEGDTNGAPRDQIDLNSHPYPEDMQVDA
ncbi:B3 domain-containing transcription repressor VAL1 [Cajanus cajan]|uniref:B3 domain-containing transcription repressor VAL1 n=1 Tax=Cajanus cajan TaxID=3821 RepID=UPI00098D984D|nr:B3 domain-containing transcription repressor VAL1 [Cajanus cajan]